MKKLVQVELGGPQQHQYVHMVCACEVFRE